MARSVRGFAALICAIPLAAGCGSTVTVPARSPAPSTELTVGPTGRPATAAPAPTPRPTPGPTVSPATSPAFESLYGAAGSAGCTMPMPDPGDTTIELAVGGVERTSLVHIPPHLTRGESRPLVLVFHGTAMDGPQMVEVTGFSAQANARGIFVAYPNAIGDLQAWNWAERPDGADDVAFERALLDRLEADYCIDTHRVYATGFSAGGAMTRLAACRDDRIAAVSMVAAAVVVGSGDCLPEGRQVPALAFHGLLDAVVPWRGGLSALPELEVQFRPLFDWLGEWARHNGCEPEAVGKDVVGDWAVPFDWQDCDKRVRLYRLGNGGHTWPGGTGLEVFGAINRDVDATALSISFFLGNAALPPEPRVGGFPWCLAIEACGLREYLYRQLGYSVTVPGGWPAPWIGRYGYHQWVQGSVTFPVGGPAMLDVWATQIVVSSGAVGGGPPTPDGSLAGRTARELADSLVARVPAYERVGTAIVDGERAIVLDGSGLPLAAVFTHRDHAFLVLVYHELPIPTGSDGELLDDFLARLRFTK